MDKRHFAVFIPLLLAIMVSWQSLFAQSGTLQYLVIEKSVRPIQIENPQAPLAGGIITDVVKKIFEGSKFKINPVVAPWLRLLKFAQENPYWLVYGPRSPEKLDGERSAEPIFIFKHIIVSRPKDHFLFRSINDLLGKNLILIHAFDYIELDPYLKSISNGPINDARPKDPEAAIKMLLSGRGIAYVEFNCRFHYALKNLNMRSQDFVQQDFSSVILPRPMHLIFDARMPMEWKKFINMRIHELNSSKEIEKIMNRYRC